MKKVLILIPLLLCGMNVTQAAQFAGTGKITEVIFYGNGMILVGGPIFGTPANNCAGYQNGFRINETDPQLDRLLSIVLAAKATQKDVTVYADIPDSNCWAPTFTENNRIIVHP